MPLNVARTHQLLSGFDFKTLFIEELGWDSHHASLDVTVDGRTFRLTAIAQKRGLVAFLYGHGDQREIPDYPTRRKIERQVAKAAHEHLIIYTDPSKTAQIWQWVKRETGKPVACREHAYHRDQPGDALIQKLDRIVFSLAEEERLTLPDVTGRTRAAFDVERVTKRFYDTFQKEHAAFLKFLKGIPDENLQRWYASVMLNRLMFVYFIQKKHFLDSNPDYLRSKLAESQVRGRDRFYREFLCPLFFEGFAKKDSERSTATNRLLGKVPYLNGGLFLRHQIEEQHGKDIQVADAAFEKLFAFFEQYHWHLDERPLRRDDEINPDVLGYIFEKYINQKQMGAYYTKEDITGYISQNTVIPFLLDTAKQKCKIAFEGNQSVWRLLQSDPDRYIYEAVKKGVALPLPEAIAAGVNDITKRTEWNKLAATDYALPTEIWREVVARRKRYEEVRGKLANGDVRNVNDLVTYNLDIRQFAQDVIENCEGPELLRAFYHAIEKVTVLDPTCGSGAFLFAALNILEPLYEACLDRMEVFLEDLSRSVTKHRPEKFSDFRKLLDRVGSHPNRRYFVLKAIIVNNLYGVDIMEEAVEICKLRLFLKLVAQIERVEDIEPLPDIDFNIRAGNTLVGYAHLEEIKKSMEGDWVRLQSLPTIEENAEIADRAFQKFHEMQIEHGMEAKDFADAKLELWKRLKALEDELNRYLAQEYGIDPAKRAQYEKWLASHKPFHWFIEFYRIMKGGGFDVVIGNPPYVEISDVSDQYLIKGLNLVSTGNLYSVCTERFTLLLPTAGRLGVIVPISSVSTPRMYPLMKHITSCFSQLHLSNFAVRPGKLFVGVDMNLTIMLGLRNAKTISTTVCSSMYNRWQEAYRPFLFENLTFIPASLQETLQCLPKIGLAEAHAIFGKIAQYPSLSRYAVTFDGDVVFYHSGGRYFRKCIREQLSNEYKQLAVRKDTGDAIICLLSSSFYYWFWITVSDCYHVIKRDVYELPMPDSLPDDDSLKQLAERLLLDLGKNAIIQPRTRADGSIRKEVNFQVSKSKNIIDEIDKALAKHYCLTPEELDFIVNYDAKYRMDESDA